MERRLNSLKYLAIALWLFVAILAGIVASVVLNLSQEEKLFAILLPVGLVLLISINVPQKKKESDAMPVSLSVPSTNESLHSAITPTKTDADNKVVIKEEVDASVAKTAVKLSGEEARKWLDDFLVRQQQK